MFDQSQEKPELSKQNKILLDHLGKSFNENQAYEIFEIISPTFWQHATSPDEFKRALSITKRGQDHLFRTAQNYFNLMVTNKKLDKMIDYALKEISK